MKNISLAMIMELALHGDDLGRTQAIVLSDLLGGGLGKAPKPTDPTQLSYKEKMAVHARNKDAKSWTDDLDLAIANKAKGKAKAKAPKAKGAAKANTTSAKKNTRGTVPSQARNVHSAAKTKAYKQGISVPQLIIAWFGRKKSEKTIAQISEGTGLTNKEVGDTCWGQVNKGVMVSKTVGSYGMA